MTERMPGRHVRDAHPCKLTCLVPQHACGRRALCDCTTCLMWRLVAQYINNLWRVDPSSFAATLNMIGMRAPALMQRLMDHEVNAANAAIGQYGNMRSSAAASSGSNAEARNAIVPSQQPPHQQQMTALQNPDELEVGWRFTPHHFVVSLQGDKAWSGIPYMQIENAGARPFKNISAAHASGDPDTQCALLFQAALSQLPMGDLNALLRYICQYMPMAPNPGTMPASQDITAPGSSSDEVCHCLHPEPY